MGEMSQLDHAVCRGRVVTSASSCAGSVSVAKRKAFDRALLLVDYIETTAIDAATTDMATTNITSGPISKADTCSATHNLSRLNAIVAVTTLLRAAPAVSLVI